MSTTSNPIVQASQATMLAGGLPPSGTVYEFINTDKGNALWYLDSLGNFYALGLNGADDCACHISEKWMCGINNALETGLMTPEEYQSITAMGLNVVAIETPNNLGGNTVSVSISSFSAPVTSVTMTSKVTTLAINASHQSGVTIAPFNGYPGVIWISSAPAIATVTQLGLIRGISAGSATITVYSSLFPFSDSTTIVVS